VKDRRRKAKPEGVLSQADVEIHPLRGAVRTKKFGKGQRRAAGTFLQ